ncbi:hypothetical protein MNEG_8064 [Monoraphidium neglectum]|uniref:Uncharacterized protein n=1 Tax=Monoraphidium neglectum TaxID=145388 RepID=A0A0D2JKV9_9CHLO|nr:hypothetical protein MNEG_8064 [Monoraphidium neglectum]KIY99897.1 hypothetical protein MNEG_8064 [Monoraphidium neglectum]|eukprot:XP_013898917.1 hypothetical protein MNEG_8064 [Monoraphidium neglectum]
MDAAGQIETFPPRASNARQPLLLQSLEALLLDEVGAAVRLAGAGPHRTRDPQGAANLALQAHSTAGLVML